MKLNVGDKYNLSEKLKKAFEVNSAICKIVSITNNIVVLQIDAETYPLKLEIAIENLSTPHTPTADLSIDSPKRKRKKKEEQNGGNDILLVQPVEPEPINSSEIPIPPPAVFPELPPSPAPEPIVEPVVVEPENTIINPENTNITPEPEQDNSVEEPENPDEGFF